MACAVRRSDVIYLIEHDLEAMHIGIFAFNTAPVARFGNASSGWFITAIELYLIEQLIGGSKELRFLALLKKLLMLRRPIRQQQATAGRDFKGACGVLVGADVAQQSKSDLGAGQRMCVVVLVHLPALVRARQQVITVKCEGLTPGKLLEDHMLAGRPPAIVQNIPVSTPDFEVGTGSGDGMQ